MKLESLNSIDSRIGRRDRRSATLDRNRRRRDGKSTGPVPIKTSSRDPRRRRPRQNDDPQRGHTLDITT